MRERLPYLVVRFGHEDCPRQARDGAAKTRTIVSSVQMGRAPISMYNDEIRQEKNIGTRGRQNDYQLDSRRSY